MDNKQAINNIKQAKSVPYKHETITTLVEMTDKLKKIKQIVNEWNKDASNSFGDMCKINGILKE